MGVTESATPDIVGAILARLCKHDCSGRDGQIAAWVAVIVGALLDLLLNKGRIVQGILGSIGNVVGSWSP